MLDELHREDCVDVPLLTDPKLARRFQVLIAVCRLVAGPSVSQDEIDWAVVRTELYAAYVARSLKAHIDEEPLPHDNPSEALTAKAYLVGAYAGTDWD